MWNVVLVVHLLLALSLIGIVLMQRSEGGGLGIGGGGGGMMSARSAAGTMTKITWLLAAAFIVTSVTLTILSAQSTDGISVIDRISDQPEPATAPAELPEGEGLLPPSEGDAPLTPSSE